MLPVATTVHGLHRSATLAFQLFDGSGDFRVVGDKFQPTIGLKLHFEFVESIADGQQIGRGKTVDETHAVDMVHLMLGCFGRETFPVKLLHLAVQPDALDDDFVRSDNLCVNFRKTETAFVRFCGTFFLRDDRIDQDELVFLEFLFAARVEYEDAIRQANLVCRQTNPVITIHHREHFNDNIPQLLVNAFDRFALVAENRMGIFDNVQGVRSKG